MSEDKDRLWLEDELQREIQLSAEEQEIPDSLFPENMVARLKEEQNNAKTAQGRKRSRQICRMIEMAAAVALVIVIGGIGGSMLHSGNATGNEAEQPDIATVAGTETDSDTEPQDENCETQRPLEGYHVASGYAEIYELLNAAKEQMIYYDIPKTAVDGAAADDSDMAYTEDASSGDIQDIQHSTTNVQQEGVDEGDLVKTDGRYIYRVKNNAIEIIDIQDKKLEKVASFEPDMDTCDRIEELYVDGDQLFVILSSRQSGFYRIESLDGSDSFSSSIKQRTVLLTYDISNRREPAQTASFAQDGSYYSSRKVDDFIYLFTQNDMYDTLYGDVEDAIPCVQEKKIACEDIYIGSQAYTELIMTSINTSDASKSVDEKAVFDGYYNIYVGNAAIYLYQDVYKNDYCMTQIAKFSYEDGKMEPVSSTLIKGEITDTFAISEKDDFLRVLTSDWSGGDQRNQLYMLDEYLNVTGQIDNIAEGESVYAARYIGDTAYFITYRNMDPLFVADLSDPYDPKLLGSVEVTGFSDYLHLYQDDLVLGIGYETDEDSNRLGVKLCMFDVSDPFSPQVKSTYIMEEADSMTADYDYKSVLVDAKKGIIGFVTESWGNEYVCEYRLFRWTGEQFEEVFSEPLNQNGAYFTYDAYQDMSRARALYVGDVLYLIRADGIQSYDMLQDFVRLGEL